MMYAVSWIVGGDLYSVLLREAELAGCVAEMLRNCAGVSEVRVKEVRVSE